MQNRSQNSKAFTLIELLIVVAIIAILAAIAVPNFLEAQVRSKVSRAKADMRSLATALEAYRVDSNGYLIGNSRNTGARIQTDPATFTVLERLSTPIGYMSNALIKDPFKSLERGGTVNPTTGDSTPAMVPASEEFENSVFKYACTASDNPSNVLALWTNSPLVKANGFWSIWSSGPDTIRAQVAGTGLLSSSATETAVLANIYDPTNGTVSRGDVFRVGGSADDRGLTFFKMVQQAQP